MKSLQELRRDARTIFAAGVEAADPLLAILRHVKVESGYLRAGPRIYELSRYKRIYVIGAGKASASMALAIEQLLGDRIDAGVVNTKYGHSSPLDRIKINEAGHPAPDEAGVRGTREIIALAQDAGDGDLVISVLSGGASALLTAPARGLTLEEKRQATEVLLRSGAAIEETNAVRKHLSDVKGGRLARIAYPATLVSLVLSDVIGNQLDVVGSGPTAPDRSTFADCLNVLSQYRIERDFPPAALAFLQRGATGGFEETPKNGSPVFRNVQNLIVGDYNLAVAGAKKQAEALGYHSFIVEPPFVGEARKIALAHTALAKNFLTDRSVSRPLCAVSGGETTVTVRGDGVGGRNQELGLTAAIEIDGQDGIVILSGGTDGTDGPTDAAGAIVDGTTLARARAKGLDAAEFLRRNDAYPFLQSVGDLLVTGPTRTNVVDLCVILVV